MPVLPYELEKIETMEDAPCGVNLLVWDGCDFRITYVDIDPDTGSFYDANYPDSGDDAFIAYAELPCNEDMEIELEAGEID